MSRVNSSNFGSLFNGKSVNETVHEFCQPYTHTHPH